MNDIIQSKLRKLNEEFNACIKVNSTEIKKLELTNNNLKQEIKQKAKSYNMQMAFINDNKQQLLNVDKQLLYQNQPSPLKIDNGIQDNSKHVSKIAQLQNEFLSLSLQYESVVIKTNEVIKKYNTLLDILTNPNYHK